MGAWVLASVLYACALLAEAQNSYRDEAIPIRETRQADGLNVDQMHPAEGGIHSAVSLQTNPETSATNYQPYNVKLYAVSSENDARGANPYSLHGYNDAGSNEGDAKYNQFSSLEADNQKDYLDTNGYDHYKTATSFNLEGPRQMETISSNSYHKEVEPYDMSGFQKSQDHKEEEQHAEVHYHQHKHLHKHAHKQEHMHKHQQEHKHEHGHKHDHKAQHDHKHEAQHKHNHNAEHKHHHKAEHQHKHQQEHKHAHNAQHKHEHKHQQEHKHGHHHGHKHQHQGEHKHSHKAEHKHDHQHGHKHENQHKHKHDHNEEHKHQHGHKNEHKHKHRSSHYHKHNYHKY